MTDKIALFDLDCTLADFEGQMCRDLERLRSPGEAPITAGNLWGGEKLPHIKARMSLIKSVPGWWYKLPTLQLGFDVLNVAREIGFALGILTKGPSSPDHSLAWSEKRDWILDHLLEYNVKTHITEDKSGQYGRVLVDDFGEYLDAWLAHRPRGLGVMIASEGNKIYRHPQVIRYDGTNLGTVRVRLQEAFDR